MNSQELLAASLNTSQSRISAWETEAEAPEEGNLRRLADLFLDPVYARRYFIWLRDGKDYPPDTTARGSGRVAEESERPYADTQLDPVEAANDFAFNRTRLLSTLGEARRKGISSEALLAFVEIIAEHAKAIGYADPEWAETLRRVVRQGGI